MKKFSFLVLISVLTASCSTIKDWQTTSANREIASKEVSLKLVQAIETTQDGVALDTIYFKDSSGKKIELYDMYGYFKVEGNSFIVQLNDDKKFFVIANINPSKVEEANRVLALNYPENVQAHIAPEILTSEDSVPVNILVSKEKRKMKGTLCSHIGCVAFPHLETTVNRLIEIKALDGTVLCYNLNVITNQKPVSIGACKQ